MFSLHRKRRTIISTIVAVAVLLPAAVFAVNKTATSQDVHALTYSIPGGYTTIVDPNFYDCVMSEFITNKYDSDIDPSTDEILASGLTDEQLGRIERLTCDGSGKPTEALITNTTGIEKMSSLWYLDLGSNLLTSVDLSGNPGMWYLDLNSNQLTSINLSSSTTLDQAYLYSNQLTSVDVSNNTKLTRLDVFDNQLTFIDVSNNASKLQTLKADDIYLYTGIVPTKSGSNYMYDLSGLKYIKDGSHGPDGNVDFTIGNTSNYSYDEPNMILAVNNLAGAGEYVPIEGTIEDYSFKLRLPVILEFDTNGGSGAFDLTSCYIGVGDSTCTVNVSSTEPTRGGYNFLGWANSASATSADYVAGGRVPLSESKTIYAVWGEDTTTYTLTFDANNGSGVPAAVSCTTTGASCSVNIPNTVPTRDGYRFLGYANSASATSAEYTAGSSLSLSADKTIYAVWELTQNTLALGFNLNGGEGTISSVTCSIDIEHPTCSVNIPNTVPTRSGYNFLGWADSASATSAAYTAGSSLTLSADKTIYAVWELVQNTLTLGFNLNGGDGTVSSASCYVDVEHPSCSVNIPNTVPTRDGYRFLGYADSASATSVAYTAGSSLTISANKTVYAVLGMLTLQLGCSTST